MKVSWTEPAAEHWEQAFEYIAASNPNAAARIARQILDAAEILATHPQAGKKGRISGTREFVIADTPFILVYGVDSPQNVLWIYAIYHASRRWPRHF